ncbi:MAG: SRPBCC domain-containing protein [Candidatus Eisenbacteria bacterium]
MLNRISVVCFLSSALALATCPVAFAEHTQVPVARIHAQAQVAAPPAAVWAWMTQGKNLVTWCPAWKAPANAKSNISKVGDVLEYSDEWGNGGRSVVTYLRKDKELRVAHEPNKGDYMCQAKVILEPVGSGTLVHVWDQYTDDSPPADAQATAKKMETELANMLAALKKGVQGK